MGCGATTARDKELLAAKDALLAAAKKETAMVQVRRVCGSRTNKAMWYIRYYI